MAKFRTIFQRNEQKYLLDETQYTLLTAAIAPYMREDEYGKSTICNLYFDTPSHRVIRRSMEKPVYKEKLRLRCYGIPQDYSNAFVELKKKFQKVVYKRRICMPYARAHAWLCENGAPPEEPALRQIAAEVEWFRHYYGQVAPSFLIACERQALFATDDPNLRITFDENIRFRTGDLDLRHGAQGTAILPPGRRLMEIKAAGALPRWLIDILNGNRIYPTSFSKYAQSFNKYLVEGEPSYVG